jgi:hypothetical protein
MLLVSGGGLHSCRLLSNVYFPWVLSDGQEWKEEGRQKGVDGRDLIYESLFPCTLSDLTWSGDLIP